MALGSSGVVVGLSTLHISTSVAALVERLFVSTVPAPSPHLPLSTDSRDLMCSKRILYHLGAVLGLKYLFTMLVGEGHSLVTALFQCVAMRSTMPKSSLGRKGLL